MMTSRIPKVNPIRLFQVGRQQAWCDSLPFWEYETNYFQKFRETDNLCFQVLLSEQSNSPINYKAVNVLTGFVEYETTFDVIAGTPYKYGSYFCYQYNAPVLGAALWTSGKLIQILLTIETEDGGPIYYKSEILKIYIVSIGI